MRHPRLENLFLIAFLAWPFALIILKIIFRQIKWRWLWFSVPIMSWITINAAYSANPMRGGAGTFAKIGNELLGWSYMIPFFGVLCLGFLLVDMLLKKRGKKAASGVTTTKQ